MQFLKWKLLNKNSEPLSTTLPYPKLPREGWLATKCLCHNHLRAGRTLCQRKEISWITIIWNIKHSKFKFSTNPMHWNMRFASQTYPRDEDTVHLFCRKITKQNSPNLSLEIENLCRLIYSEHFVIHRSSLDAYQSWTIWTQDAFPRKLDFFLVSEENLISILILELTRMSKTFQFTDAGPAVEIIFDNRKKSNIHTTARHTAQNRYKERERKREKERERERKREKLLPCTRGIRFSIILFWLNNEWCHQESQVTNENVVALVPTTLHVVEWTEEERIIMECGKRRSSMFKAPINCLPRLNFGISLRNTPNWLFRKDNHEIRNHESHFCYYRT